MRRRLDTLLKIVALGSIAATFAPFAARVYWLVELTTHFRVQYLAAQIVLLLVFAGLRRPRWAVALTACAAINGWAAWPYLPAPWRVESDAVVAGTPIKVLTANLWYHTSSTGPLLDLVRHESPDVVVLVEFTPQWDEAVGELRSTYPYRVESPAYRAAGVAVYSRYQLENAKAFDLGSRTAIEAKVHGPDGPFTLLGVHLRSPTSRWYAHLRNQELKLLAQRVKDTAGPVMVTGDFNITPFSPYFADLLDATGLKDTRYERNFTPSWPTFVPFLAIPIDHFVVSREFHVVLQRQLPAFGSDHYAVLAELALTPAAPSAPTASVTTSTNGTE